MERACTVQEQLVRRCFDTVQVDIAYSRYSRSLVEVPFEVVVVQLVVVELLVQ